MLTEILLEKYCFEAKGIDYVYNNEEFTTPVLADVIADIEDYYMEGLSDILIVILYFDDSEPELYAVRKKNKSTQEVIKVLIKDLLEKDEECEVTEIRMVY